MRTYPKNILVAQGPTVDESIRWSTPYIMSQSMITDAPFGWFRTPDARTIKLHSIRGFLQEASEVVGDGSCDISISLHLATIASGSVTIGTVVNDGSSDVGFTIDEGKQAATYSMSAGLILGINQYYIFKVAAAGNPVIRNTGSGLTALVEFGTTAITTGTIEADEVTGGSVQLVWNGTTEVTVTYVDESGNEIEGATITA